MNNPHPFFSGIRVMCFFKEFGFFEMIFFIDLNFLKIIFTRKMNFRPFTTLAFIHNSIIVLQTLNKINIPSCRFFNLNRMQ